MNGTLSWRMHAACLGMAPMFDLTIGDDTRRHRETTKVQAARHERAKAVCGRCPVADFCLADARPGHDEGVRAGRLLPSIDRAVAS